jgi:hypothetical protein
MFRKSNGDEKTKSQTVKPVSKQNETQMNEYLDSFPILKYQNWQAIQLRMFIWIYIIKRKDEKDIIYTFYYL